MNLITQCGLHASVLSVRVVIGRGFAINMDRDLDLSYGISMGCIRTYKSWLYRIRISLAVENWKVFRTVNSSTHWYSARHADGALPRLQWAQEHVRGVGPVRRSYKAFIPRVWLFQLTARLYAAMTDFLSGKLDGVKAVLGGELMVWFSGSMPGCLQKEQAKARQQGGWGNCKTRTRARPVALDPNRHEYNYRLHVCP